MNYLIKKFISWYIIKRCGGECYIKETDSHINIYTDKMYRHIQKLLSDEWRKEHE